MAVPEVKVYVDFVTDALSGSNFLYLDSPVEGLLDEFTLGGAISPVDVTDNVERVSIRKGRNRITNRFEAGTADVVVIDENGSWNPDNTASPYYPNVLPLRRIMIKALYNGVLYPLFTGYIQKYNNNYYRGVDGLSRVVLQCTDAFSLFSASYVTTVTGAANGDTGKERIDQILDMISFPAALRKLDTGNTVLANDPGTNRSVLEALQTIEQTELGGIYVDSIGRINFISRDDLILSEAFVGTYIYADEIFAAFVTYESSNVLYDDTFLVNDVTVQRTTVNTSPPYLPQNAFDQTSIDKYFVHSGERTDVLLQTDAEALDMARMILATRKDPETRIDEVNLNLYDQQATDLLQVGAISLELLARIRVRKTIIGAQKLIVDPVILGINHDITRNSWKTKFLTGEPYVTGFVLNSSFGGILDEDVLSY